MPSTQCCTFTIDREGFGIDISRVQEVIRHAGWTPVPLAPPEVRGLINLRGQIVTVLDLRMRLGRGASRPEGLATHVVLRSEGGAVSLLVDEVGDVIDLMAEAWEEAPSTLSPELGGLVQGVCQLPDRLLLLLDPDEVVRTSGHDDAGPHPRFAKQHQGE